MVALYLKLNFSLNYISIALKYSKSTSSVVFVYNTAGTTTLLFTSLVLIQILIYRVGFQCGQI